MILSQNYLRQIIPFLQLLSDSLYSNMDSSEFFLPDGFVAEERKKLEEQLGHFVMTYKRDMFIRNIPLNKHLCANVKGANLTKTQRELLNNAEHTCMRYKVSFVVYEKPLKLIPIAQSPFYFPKVSIMWF